MKEDKLFKVIIFLLLSFIFAFYVWLRIENSQNIREPRSSFGDVHEYFEVASQPVTSRSFWIAIRPPVIPLIYKSLGSNENNISNFQLWLSIMSWLFLALAIMGTNRSYIVKVVAFVTVLAFSLSQDVIMWDYLILSESIAISLMIIFFATSILLISNWTWPRMLMFGIAGLLLVFARDSFSYYFLMIGCGLLLLVFFVPRKKYLLLVSAYLLLMFITSMTLASVSGRWYRSLLNTISVRILPNDQYVSYFESRGMPVDSVLLSRSGKPLHADNNILMTDQHFLKFRDWVMENGKREYVRFLWFYKADALQNIFQDLNPLFNPNLYYYSATGFEPIIKDVRISELLYPDRFSLFILLMVNILAAAASVWALYERRIVWLLPLALILFTYPQAAFIWNADAYEIGRHSIYHNIQWRLGAWVLILYILDFLLEMVPKSPIKQLIRYER